MTGASTGIGRACATRFAARGFRVFAGVRKSEDGEALKGENPGDIIPLLIDVSDQDSIASAKDTVKSVIGDNGLSGLINNAGIAVAGPLEFLPPQDFERQLAVNLQGLLRTVQAFLPLLRPSKGRVVIMGSVSGRVAFPFIGAYSVSKFGIEAFGDSLRMELKPFGIPVTLIEPGAVSTPIWNKSRQNADESIANLPKEGLEYYGPVIEAVRSSAEKAARIGVSPELVAQVVEKAITSRRPRARYLVGWDARMLVFLKIWAPIALFDRIILRLAYGKQKILIS